MIEVFKTNVRAVSHANMLVGQIRNLFGDYDVNFDLDDYDNILRIKSKSDIQSTAIISLLKDFGFKAELLGDRCFGK